MRSDDPTPEHSYHSERGKLDYLQIPATDLRASGTFYAAVFGWKVGTPPDTGFEAPGLIGQWVETESPARDGTMIPWLHVDDIEIALVTTHTAGGEVLTAPAPDGPYRILATIADPAGNTVGLVQFTRG